MISAKSQWVELIPAGRFFTNDGRGPFWNHNPAEVIAASIKLLAGGLPIDFDHATVRAAPEGLPAPAAGWIREFRVVAGAIQGRVEWTPRGAQALAMKEYRFVSPVFDFEPPAGSVPGSMTGRVVSLRNAALTNNPALSQLPALAASRRENVMAATAITDQERKIGQMMGIDITDARYLQLKADRLSGRPMMFPYTAVPSRNRNGGTGIIGPGTASEAYQVHRPEIESGNASPEQLANEALRAIQGYLKSPSAPDAWKQVARASAFLTGCLDLCAPAYADRVDEKGVWRVGK